MTETKSISLSQLFEETYEEFDLLLNSNDPTNAPEFQRRIKNAIRDLEELTKGVSAVDMFSRNENHEELDPQVMKFLLLPYMLGSLWQINTGEERRQICEVSEIYFKDFLKRCRDYEFINAELEEEPETEESGGGGGPRAPKKVRTLTPEEKRNRKIKKLKENKELDNRIKSFRESIAEEKDPDATALREVYTALILRAINRVEDELESIKSEMELISFAEKRSKDESTGATSQEPAPPLRQPLKPFIITKDATQKKVFGLGYPSYPVMTVEELYAQRRATGEWGPPPANGAGFTNPENTGEEEEEVALETLSEQDDEANLQRQRQNDEYRDDHRRGWGNRFNRS